MYATSYRKMLNWLDEVSMNTYIKGMNYKYLCRLRVLLQNKVFGITESIKMLSNLCI